MGFSNSLTIHQGKTKKITTVKDVLIPGTRFSKLPIITEPVKLFCFPFQKGVSKLLKIIQ